MADRFPNPVPQFLDDSGNPVPNGKLFFYENGTTTFKDTFADVNLTIPNDNPVLLSGSGRVPNIFYNGTARVKFTNEVGLPPTGTQFWDRDAVGTAGGGLEFDTWNNITEYQTGALVEASDGEYYRSLQGSNVGNDPTTSAAFWEKIEFIRTWNANVPYAVTGIAKASDGRIYRSLVANNLNNDPISSPTQWGISPFDQDLNTTDNVEFVDIEVTGDASVAGTTTVAALTYAVAGDVDRPAYPLFAEAEFNFSASSGTALEIYRANNCTVERTGLGGYTVTPDPAIDPGIDFQSSVSVSFFGSDVSSKPSAGSDWSSAYFFVEGKANASGLAAEVVIRNDVGNRDPVDVNDRVSVQIFLVPKP